jgi:myosin-1
MYTIDPKSYAVLRRIPFDKLEKMMCSALPDGVFLVSAAKQYDTVFEADNKSAVMKAIRDAYELYTEKPLKVDINSDFQFSPKRGVLKSLKFVKNYHVKGTLIEATSDGLVVSVKPSDDVFDGKKLRRKNSFHKKYFGDYIRLQNSDLMKQIEKDYGDKHVLFSGVVGKFNKKYKRQDRILMITERAVYNLDPNGYMINRRIPLRRIKGVAVSPLTDGFFILNVPDEYDYLMESNKKTEILKVLAENYTAATRSTLKFVVKEKFVTSFLINQ